MDQLDLIDIYMHFTKMYFTFFSSAHRTLSRIDHILGHNLASVKLKSWNQISSIWSKCGLDINYRKITIKNTNIWRLNNMLLNSQQIMEEIKQEIKICIETNANENTTIQTYGIQEMQC